MQMELTSAGTGIAGGTPALPVTPVISVQASAAASLPKVVEYTVAGEAWRCGHFDRLGAELPELAAGERSDWPVRLTRLQDAICGSARAWLIVRRLFGIQPVLPPRDFVADDFREWGREELREALGLTRAQLAAELEAVRGVVQGMEVQRPMPHVQSSEPAVVSAAAARGELGLEDGGAELLERHGIDVAFDSRGQRAWFLARVGDFEKLLEEQATSGLARNTLMTELQLRNLDVMLADKSQNRIGGPDWRANMKARQELDATYQKQLQLINTLAPWASAITGKYAFTGVLSDVTAAIQAYHARGETRLIDGMFTAMGIRVECRRSVQLPEPRYRAGLAVYVAAAKAGLWDPNWTSPFTSAELKRVDAAWRAAFVAVSDAAGITMPDLEKDGAEGEYESLKATVPSPTS